METYSFWADMLTTFRSSSDLVKVVWLLMPGLSILGIVYSISKLRKPPLTPLPLPIITFHSCEHGKVAVYNTKESIELRAIDDLGEIIPLLSISKRIINNANKNIAKS